MFKTVMNPTLTRTMLQNFVILFLTVGGVRFFLRELQKTNKKDDRKKVAIYGAGEAGRQLLKTLNY